MVGQRKHRGGAGATALGLMALGFASAVFGAMVLGPSLGRVAYARGSEFSGLRNAPERPEPAEPPSDGQASDDSAAERPALDDASVPATGEPSEIPADAASVPPDDAPLRPAEPVDEKKPEPTRVVGAPTRKPSPPAKPLGAGAAELARKLTPERAVRAEPVTPVTVKPEGRSVEPPRSEAGKAESGSATPKADVLPTVPVRPSEPKAVAARPGGKPRPVAPLKPAVEASVKPTEPLPPEASADGSLFRVRVGRYRTQEEAEKARDEVNRAANAGASVYRSGDVYRVQVGAFRRKENADKIVEQLRARNLPAEVTDQKAPKAPDKPGTAPAARPQ